MLCDDLEGWDGGVEGSEGGGENICVHIADSHCYTTEMNTAL